MARGDVPGPTIYPSGRVLDGDPPVFPGTSTVVRTPGDAQWVAGVDLVKVHVVEWHMNKASGRFLLWRPRILGMLVCLFLGLFALDAFDGDTCWLSWVCHGDGSGYEGLLFFWSWFHHRGVRADAQPRK